jgi:hypothetical protein
MSIAVHNVDGRYCPRISCAVCQQPITEPTMAAVLFDMSAPDAAPPVFVHKGACMQREEARIRNAGGFDGWEELSRWLISLLHNTGLHGEDLSRAVERAAEWHEVGL